MTERTHRSRRRVVLAVGRAAAVGGLAGLAGCPGGGGPAADEGTEPTATGRGATVGTDAETGSGETDRGTAGGETADGETAGPTATVALDLREANVTDVAVTPGAEAYGFDVTLYHDDDGEEGYANWWQVETLDGERLGRRELAHPHSTEPFTRSEAIEIPEGVTCVVVRGHDQTHGYGGQAVLVTLDGGATRAVEQGSEPQSFADAACPSPAGTDAAASETDAPAPSESGE